MQINLPEHVNFILNTLQAAGFEAYIVGGCVRDIIRGVQPKDWDITTSATPLEAKANFLRTIDTGIKHGTITVLLDGQPYEVTTYRIDGEYLDNRRPQTVEFTTNIEEDLSRRDFTMNAIAYSPITGFVDPFGGQEDINRGLIRCVGDPLHRFGEDALRMLRAIRFAAVTGFDINKDILTAISVLKATLQNISPERIREEFGKLITSQNPETVVLLDKTGLLPFVLGNRDYEGDIIQAAHWLTICPSQESMRLALFLYNQIDCEKLLQAMRFDNKTAKEAAMLVRLLYEELPANRYQIKKILRFVPQALFENFLTLNEIISPNNNVAHIRSEVQDIVSKAECFTLKNLAINGVDLKALGIEQGEAMGKTLEWLLDEVMQNPTLNQKKTLLECIANKN